MYALGVVTPPSLSPLEERASRIRILEAALRLFAQRGFAATPTKKIAEQAEVPSGLIFYYYGNKRGLLTAILREGAFLAHLQRRFDALEETLPPRALLLALVEMISAEVSANLEVMRVIISEMQHYPEVLKEVRQLRESFSLYAASRLVKKFSGTPLEQIDTQLIVKVLFSNLIFMHLVDQEPPTEAQLKSMADAVWYGSGK